MIIIMTDQQTVDAMSIACDKDWHTPVVDKLTQNGTRFAGAYCAQPLCTSSRTAIMSDKMPFETFLSVTHYLLIICFSVIFLC